jgi:hypothetical protein
MEAVLKLMNVRILVVQAVSNAKMDNVYQLISAQESIVHSDINAKTESVFHQIFVLILSVNQIIHVITANVCQ